jgi:aspartate 1-decarboxylase
MFLHACRAKIHRATVTQAELNYVGSITIDEDLLDAAGIRPFQYLNITSIANGTFWRTYAMAGERGSGMICLNGSPAHHFKPGDLIIILAEVLVEPDEMDNLDPVVVFVDEKNKVTEIKKHSLAGYALPLPIAAR